MIQEGLMEVVDGIPVGDFTPRFQETYLHRGSLKVTCVDKQSAIWLKGQVRNLRKWEGADLEVIEAHELLKYVRVMAWIPGAPMDTAVMLRRLEKLNSGLATGRWIIHERHEDASGKGVRLALGVDHRAIPTLQAQGMRPYLGMGRASFRLLDAHSKKAEGEKMDTREDATNDGKHTSQTDNFHAKYDGGKDGKGPEEGSEND